MVRTRSASAASSIRRRSAAWPILLDSMCRSRKRASALWMMRARSCGKRGLEYDDDRSGSFAPLRHVPDDKIVVLGLISTKRPQMEAPEDLIRRITQASRFVPLELLALSTQCGFASSILGNGLSIDDERRKLATVCESARRIWMLPPPVRLWHLGEGLR